MTRPCSMCNDRPIQSEDALTCGQYPCSESKARQLVNSSEAMMPDEAVEAVRDQLIFNLFMYTDRPLHMIIVLADAMMVIMNSINYPVDRAKGLMNGYEILPAEDRQAIRERLEFINGQSDKMRQHANTTRAALVARMVKEGGPPIAEAMKTQTENGDVKVTPVPPTDKDKVN